MRVRPRAWTGLAVWALYLVVVVAIQAGSGIPYSEWGDSASNLWRGSVVSLAAGAVVLAAVTTWLGWWRPALRERRTTRARWTAVAPVLVVVAVVSNLLGTDWGEVGADFVVAGLALGVLVGFNEELTSRGLLLTGLRGSTREIAVALTSSALFGVMHGVNIILGQSVGETLPQVGQAFLLGLTFYVLRRVTGSLIGAMALHGAWDFSVFAIAASDGSNPLGALAVLAGLLALATFWFAARDVDGEQVPGRVPAPTPPTTPSGS